jgi:predicted nucleic acid-binding protein
MALYLDTSCLLKLLFAEPDTPRVASLLVGEPRVVGSTLARLEALVQIHGRAAGGHLARRAARRLVARLDSMLEAWPFELVPSSGTLIATAEAQLRGAAGVSHCRTMDRLHLAAMQELGLGRLLTNDESQARAAAALGFAVVRP